MGSNHKRQITLMAQSNKKEGTARDIRSFGKSSAPLRIVIAGGEPAAIFFRGIALAQEIYSQKSEQQTLICRHGKPFETTALSKAGFAINVLHRKESRVGDFGTRPGLS